MISLVLFIILYVFGIYIINIFLDQSFSVLTYISVFIGYLYATHIEPWIKSIKLDLNKLNKNSIKLGKGSLTVIWLTTTVIFGTIASCFIYLGNTFGSTISNELHSILIQTIFAILSLIMIPLFIVVVFFIINKRIDYYKQGEYYD